MQRGRELAERAQSTSKLLREDVLRGAAAPKQAPRRPSWVDHPAAGGPAAGGPGGNATMDAPGGGVAALAKHLEDFTAAFARISEATGAKACGNLNLPPTNALPLQSYPQCKHHPTRLLVLGLLVKRSTINPVKSIL